MNQYVKEWTNKYVVILIVEVGTTFTGRFRIHMSPQHWGWAHVSFKQDAHPTTPTTYAFNKCIHRHIRTYNQTWTFEIASGLI